jgi:hypothetical protein
MSSSSTGKKGGRKYGRVKRKPCHQVYNAKRQWFHNKVRRIVKQMKKFPNWKPYNLSPDVKTEVNKRLEKLSAL